MPYFPGKSPSRLTILVTAFFVVAAVDGLWLLQRGISYLATGAYAAIALCWTMSMRHRIISRNIRTLLTLCGMLTFSLFVIRFLRWHVFADWEIASLYLWYLMYVPFLGVPLLSFFASLCVGRKEDFHPLGGYLPLVYVYLMLLALVMTNNVTGLVFQIERTADGFTYRYMPLLYVMSGWEAFFSIAAFVVLMQRCSRSKSRRHWYLLAGWFAFGVALIAIYTVGGGAPMVFGVRLYNIQEVCAFLVLVLWETSMEIGLLPSNTDYAALFRASHSNAAILDANGRVVYATASYQTSPAGDSILSCTHSITKGSVVWWEDHSRIQSLNEELTQVNGELMEENTLLAKENQILGERAAYEERNRLYDAISEDLQTQLAHLEHLLASPCETKEQERENLVSAMVLGAYVKRRANLILLAEQRERISALELYLSIRESMEYLTLAGCACDVRGTEDVAVPSAWVLSAYQLFEAIAEEDGLVACDVEILARDGFSFCIAADTGDKLSEQLRQAVGTGLEGLSFHTFREDDTVYYRLYETRLERGRGI